MRNITRPLFMIFVFVFGCVIGEDVFSGDPSFSHQHASYSTGNTPHPPGSPSIWKGRNVSELLEGLGEPDIVLDTAVRGFVIYGDTPSVMYVYVPGKGTGGACYGAYVIEHDSGEVLGYHCR